MQTPAAVVDVPLDGDVVEVPALARVHRSRLAFAVGITLAALPVLVLDNLPATAESSEAHVGASSRSAGESWASEPSRSFKQADDTTTTEAPTTTAAPAPTTTEAPATSEAMVQALQAAVAVAPPPTAPPSTAPPTTAPPLPYGDPNDPVTWDRLAQCESSGHWAMNSGNGYYGGIQFSLATWQDVGGVGYPHHATKSEQIHRGKILQAQAGWDQWPVCAKRLGYY